MSKDWEKTKPLGRLYDERPAECQTCDYDYWEDCTEGCKKIVSEEEVSDKNE